MAKTIFVTEAVNDRLWAYIEAVDTEIGGFGYAELQEDGDFIWHHIFLVPQEVSAGGVDFLDNGIPFAIEKAAADGCFDNPNFVWVKWHSHGKLSSYWSSTDDDANKRMRATGVPYMLDFVGNHKHEWKARLELYHMPLHIPQITLNDVKFERLRNPATADVQSEIAEHVVEMKATGFTGSGYGSWYQTGNAKDDKGKDIVPFANSNPPTESSMVAAALFAKAFMDENAATTRIADWNDPDLLVIEFDGYIKPEEAAEWDQHGWEIMEDTQGTTYLLFDRAGRDSRSAFLSGWSEIDEAVEELNAGDRSDEADDVATEREHVRS